MQAVRERKRLHRQAGLRALAAVISLALIAGCSSKLPLHRAPLPFRQAEDSFKLGHYDRAVHGYRIFIDSNEVPELVPRAYFKMARAEYRLGNYDKCIAALDELEARYPDDEWRQVYELRGDAENARGNTVSAVLFWERALEDADRSRGALLRRRISEAAAQMDRDTATRARAVVTRDETRVLIDAARGSGAAPAATPRVAQAQSAATPPAAGAARGMSVSAAKIGVLLPLSGKYEAYGQSSLSGIKLAIEESESRLVVRDTEGEAHIARAALDELLADESVVAILGPLRSQVAPAVSPRAERAGVPLFSLAQNNTMSGRFVMQTAMTYAMQARQLVDFATRSAGIRKFGVLYPRDPYGSALAEAFHDEVARRAGRVVGSLAYEPGATEFSVEVLTLQRWVDSDGLQAVFIPDFAATAGVLSQSLRAARPGVFLLGSNGWHDPGQLGALADSLNGAVFVDGFFVGSQRPATQRFLNAFRTVNGNMPGVLAAQAYDAASVLDRALSTQQTVSRMGLADAIRSMGRYDGAAGALVFSDGGVDRELFVLKFDGSRIREVGAAASATSAASYAPIRPEASP